MYKIATTYDNGEIFQHFGRSEHFKVYVIEHDKIVSSEVIDTNGAGHSALAGVLADAGISLLICGGIGDGAKSALDAEGIVMISGAVGSADAVVEAFLNGTLEEHRAANCHEHGEGHSCGHHDHEEGGCCGHDDESGCCGHGGQEEVGGCGGGCCGHHQPSFEGPNVGKAVRVHYRGTFNDGSQFDASYDRGETLNFTCGAGQMIPGFDKAVATMEVGETVNIHLMPNEAYGEKDPSAIFTVAIAQMPGAETLKAGDFVYLQDVYGQPIPVTVVSCDEDNITFDANHEMAGKELNFEITLVEVC